MMEKQALSLFCSVMQSLTFSFFLSQQKLIKHPDPEDSLFDCGLKDTCHTGHEGSHRHTQVLISCTLIPSDSSRSPHLKY